MPGGAVAHRYWSAVVEGGQAKCPHWLNHCDSPGVANFLPRNRETLMRLGHLTVMLFGLETP